MDFIQLLFITTLLLVWNLFVIHYLAKWTYNFTIKYKDIPAEHVSKKIARIFCGRVTTVLIPLFYDGYYEIVTAAAFGLAFYLLIRRKQKSLHWFQIQQNKHLLHM